MRLKAAARYTPRHRAYAITNNNGVRVFKIMTLNINHYAPKHGPWSQRRDRIAALLTDLQPDVVALQAVRRDQAVEGSIDQARQLQALVADLRHAHFAALAEDAAAGRGDGSAFLARTPLATHAPLPLTYYDNAEDPNRRALVPADCTPAGTALRIVNGHFSWVPALNRQNSDETANALAAISGAGIFVGDLNATPESDGMRRLSATGWIDAWALLRGEEPGYTFEADRPHSRIDYVWVSPKLAPRLRAIDVVTGGDVRLSDHFGLIATFD